MPNPLTTLRDHGQSVWLDYIRRGLITSGELRRLIEMDGVMGVTSNPAIFEKAIAGSTDYEDDLRALEGRTDLDAKARYEVLAIRDVQESADVLGPVYVATGRRDGYVSLEVSPALAHDTPGTIEEARRLWTAVGRQNAMIKVPATPAGIPAVRDLIGEGINVNVTLLFDQDTYEQVAEAYIAGLERFAASGGDVWRVAGVASFFVSRIDSLVDRLIAARLEAAPGPVEQVRLRSLLGKVAIANARLAYQRYGEICLRPRWRRLATQGAQPQRLLWASTGTKNPSYRDVLYVEELIGPETVNTVPPATLDAFRDHGKPRRSLDEGLAEAAETMAALETSGISMREVTDRLLEEGVALFADAFVKLLDAVRRRCRPADTVRTRRFTSTLPAELGAAVNASLRDWSSGAKVRRLWARDATLWTGSDESRWLAWLRIADDQLVPNEDLDHALGAGAGMMHALLLGMGGSSLCPEVLTRTFDRVPGHPRLLVLDTTDPAQIRAVETQIDLGRTLFIVSSKSGGTLEPSILAQHFLERVRQVTGEVDVGARFIAITDPGSKLAELAAAEGFRHVFLGLPGIGGRYSALSAFGLVPAAIMGLDVGRLVSGAQEMAHACASCVPIEDNPGAVLGTVLGALATHGRDKVTLIASPRIEALGAWIEQLLAESTGKAGLGIIPVDREPLGSPGVYGSDRLFVYLRLGTAPDPLQDAAVAALEQAGQPVVRIALDDPYDLGVEFFRWEFATAVAGSIMGVNPFDQPDVEASKTATRRLMAEHATTGGLPAEAPILEAGPIALFADERNRAALAAAGARSLVDTLRAHLERIRPGNYLALLAYLEANEASAAELQAMRAAIRDRYRIATCLGFGPRFLHSTGQAYKGGPNSGVFLQITCDDARDLPVPGQRYTFGAVKAAQARGDFDVLAARGRRALRVHLGADVSAGLAMLRGAIEVALA